MHIHRKIVRIVVFFDVRFIKIGRNKSDEIKTVFEIILKRSDEVASVFGRRQRHRIRRFFQRVKLFVDCFCFVNADDFQIDVYVFVY